MSSGYRSGSVSLWCEVSKKVRELPGGWCWYANRSGMFIWIDGVFARWVIGNENNGISQVVVFVVLKRS